MDSDVAAALRYISATGWKPGDPAPTSQSMEEKRIREDYPSIAWMLDQGDPELKKLMLEAFDPLLGFNEAQFESKLYDTKWWKEHSAAEREYLTAKYEDPATLHSTIEAKTSALGDWIRSVFDYDFEEWSIPQIRKYAEIAVRKGLSDNQIQDMIMLHHWSANPDFLFEGGTGASIYQRVKATASDYMIPIDQRTAMGYTWKTLSGGIDQQGLEGTFMEMAREKYPHLNKYFDMGITPGQFFEPHRQEIATQLELAEGAGGVDLLNDKRFQSIVSYDDEGEIRPMTVSEVGRYVRGLEDWQYTTNAHQQAAGITEELLQTFGKVA